MTDKHTSTFQRATMQPPTHFFNHKNDRYPIPSNPMRATLEGTRGHPTARDGSAAVMTPAIIYADFSPDGDVLRLETEHHVFTKETAP